MSTDDYIYGLHAVTARLRAGEVIELWMQAGRRDRRFTELAALARSRKVAIHEATRTSLDQLAASVRHQGVVARISGSEARGEGALAALLERHTGDCLLLVLDGVQDPHNLGACLRTADAAGVQAVIAPRDRAVGLTPVVRKVAAGAAENTPFFQVTNLARTLRRLQSAGIWLVGAAGEAQISVYDADLKGRLALVAGAEGKGLRRLTREQCDLLVRIPMAGSVESLNVSVATGILLFEALRQRSRETQD